MVYGTDPRLANGLELLCSKQDEQGHWPLEYTYNGKTWVDVEVKGKPSKWVTIRALRVLKAAGHLNRVPRAAQACVLRWLAARGVDDLQARGVEGEGSLVGF